MEAKKIFDTTCKYISCLVYEEPYVDSAKTAHEKVDRSLAKDNEMSLSVFAPLAELGNFLLMLSYCSLILETFK